MYKQDLESPRSPDEPSALPLPPFSGESTIRRWLEAGTGREGYDISEFGSRGGELGEAPCRP